MDFMKSLHIVNIILLLNIATPCESTNVVRNISNINGLSNNAVNCIYEDSDRLIWFGTWDGLNSYNGRDIKTYRYSRNDSTSISNNIIRQIIEQNERYLWVATDFGINRWDRKSKLFTRYYAGTEKKTPKQERSYILGMTSDKTIVCFVQGEGLFYFKDTDGEFVHIPADFTDYLKDFVIDDQNRLHVLFQDGDAGYYNLERNTRGLKLKEINTLALPCPVKKLFYSNGHIIANTENILILLDVNLDTEEEVTIDIPKNISEVVYHQNTLFISFYEGGCIAYDLDKGNRSWIEEVNERTSIFSLCYGSQDILWIGSDGQGVFQLYDYNFPFNTVYTDHPVRSFCEKNDNHVMIGTKGGGILLLDKETSRIKPCYNTENGLISNSVYSIVKNSSGDIFIGTEGEGVNIVYNGSSQVATLDVPPDIPYFKAVYSIHFTHNDSLLWLGTSGYGLLKMQLEKNDAGYRVTGVEQYISSDQLKPLNNDVVYSIVSDAGNVWFGTRGGGVYKVAVAENHIEHMEDAGKDIQLTNNDILSLLLDSSCLWIGTSYGLNRLDISGTAKRIRQYTEHSGLNNNTIHGILKDKENTLWISTSQGLTMINENDDMNSFTFKDGLQNDEFADGAYFKDPEDNLYFGGVNGFNYFNPQNIRFRDYKAPIRLSGLRIYNTEQNISERIDNGVLKLGYDERYVTFNFISKDFINNENCSYAYRLKEYADEWIYMGNNPNIVFSKLPPGQYRLEVKNTNGDKRWGDEIYRLKIQVGYPWWLGAPAICIYIALFSIIIYVALSVVRNRIRMSRQILIEQIELQSQQKAYEAKLNFFTNVAHEFFTPLTLISGGSEHLLEKAEVNSYTKKYLQIIKNNAGRMQRLISELMEFRKAKSGFTPLHAEEIDVRLLTEYVSDNYQEVLQENKIDLRMNMHNISTLYSDRDSLEKIFFNLFSNAFKYTPRNGYIHVDIRQDEGRENTLDFVIKNSGKGLTEQQMSEIFNKHKIFDTPPNIKSAVSTGVGLNLTKSLVELLGGNIQIRSRLGEYVEFIVAIPPLKDNIHTFPVRQDNAMTATHIHEAVPETVRKDIDILIVDDEKHIRALLRDILSPLYTVSEAANGKEALEIIRQNHPHIIITDIMMPDVDGISLIDNLKSDTKTGYIPIVGLSAKTSIEDFVNAYTHGADMYIAKPFHPKHVISAINNLLSKQTLLKEYFNSGISSLKVKDGARIHQDDEQLLREIIEYIHKNMDDESLDPNRIAEFMNISKATLYRKLKDITGKTPGEFLRTLRLEYAAKLLTKTKLTVSEIMYRSGFTNKSYFYREFQKVYGTSPKEYRSKTTP
jgi:signal transduction histidine kinase/CheY-like chemotaxis protein/AraC-like DNA-binding protein/ligand-binding sensor domain-containing protein